MGAEVAATFRRLWSTMPSDFESTASRVCLRCGMCCNGVLFGSVRLDAGEAGRVQRALSSQPEGEGECRLRQPCVALADGHCTIYGDRPRRCREFDCRQIQLLAARQVDEEEVLQLIDEVKARVARVEGLLTEEEEGTGPQRSLNARYSAVVQSGRPLPAALEASMSALQARLDRNFRVSVLK
jgi:Fe-S-cluster containining protein